MPLNEYLFGCIYKLQILNIKIRKHNKADFSSFFNETKKRKKMKKKLIDVM